MSKSKLRRTLITVHLLLASFFMPGLLLVAITGGNYLVGNKGKFDTQALQLPAGTTLDYSSPELKKDVQILMMDMGLKPTFEYVKHRGKTIQTRPTSRPFVEITKTDSGLKASLKTPNLQASMMELHKGHGPHWFKIYQKLMALGLIVVILGGFLVGLLSPAYRMKTVISLAAGVFVTGFILLLT